VGVFYCVKYGQKSVKLTWIKRKTR